MGMWEAIKATPVFGKPFEWGEDAVNWGKDQWDEQSKEGGMLGDPKGTADRLRQGKIASEFANKGQQGFNSGGAAMGSQMDALGRIQSGEESVSRLQLQQALGQNIAGQQAMAASARPGSGAMAGRSAMMNAGRAASGLAGQQAVAGIQERQGAMAAYNKLMTDKRQQDLTAALQSRANSINAFNPKGPSESDKKASIFGDVMTMGAAAFSDKRLKKNIRDGDDDAEDFIKSLKAYKFDYKDSKNGAGEQLGIMAQDLGKSKHGRQAVFDTGKGLAVHGTKLSTALAASLPRMLSRIEKLEGKGGK